MARPATPGRRTPAALAPGRTSRPRAASPVGVFDTADSASVPIRDDDAPERDETFTVTLAAVAPANPFGAFLGPVGDRIATVTIANDDAPLTARRLRGVVRIHGRRLRSTRTVVAGDVIDARRGAARLRLTAGAVTVAGGRFALRSATALALVGRGCRRATVTAPPGVTVRAGRIATRAIGGRARWTLTAACGTRPRILVRSGRVRELRL